MIGAFRSVSLRIRLEQSSNPFMALWFQCNTLNQLSQRLPGRFRSSHSPYGVGTKLHDVIEWHNRSQSLTRTSGSPEEGRERLGIGCDSPTNPCTREMRALRRFQRVKGSTQFTQKMFYRASAFHSHFGFVLSFPEGTLFFLWS